MFSPSFSGCVAGHDRRRQAGEVQPVPIVGVDLVVRDVLVDQVDQRRLVDLVALAVGADDHERNEGQRLAVHQRVECRRDQLVLVLLDLEQRWR
jgi:hypothetical protein